MSAPLRWLLGSAAVSLVTLGVTQVAAGRVESRPAGAQSAPTVEAVASHMPSISADGHLIAFAAAPTDAGDPRESTIFVQQRDNGSIVEITPLSADVHPGESVWPVLSGDGCTVMFVTQIAYDLFRDDDQGSRWDIYSQTLPTCGGTIGDAELVSSGGGSGFQAAAADNVSAAEPPAVSADGTVVAYTHSVGAAADGLTGITLVDLTVPFGTDGRSQSVAGTPLELPVSSHVHSGLRQPSISADGTVVAYTSDADSAAATPTWGTDPLITTPAPSDVFVWDRTVTDVSTSVHRVSRPTAATATGATMAIGNADSASVSADGRFVAFVSTATDLVPGAVLPACSPTCLPQVYLFGRDDSTLRLVSRVAGDPSAPPIAADAGATQPALGLSDGEVLFVSRSTNLFPTRSSGVGAPTDGDIVSVYPISGEVQRVSVLADGVTPAPAANAHPRSSLIGRVVVFDTLAGGAFATPTPGTARVAGRQVAIVDRLPQVEIANLDMGTVAVDSAGPEWYLVLTNHGPAAFVPGTIETSERDFVVSGGSCLESVGMAIAPGAACTVQIMLLPRVAGPLSGTLTITEDGESPVSVTAELTGVGGDPTLAPTPSGGYGGDVVVGATGETMKFTLANVTNRPLKVATLALAGTHPNDFVISSDRCTDRKVAAGTTCELSVTFRPTAGGRRSATVVAQTSTDVYATILVSGDAHYAPTLSASAPAVLAGSRLAIVGSGFAPNANVTVAWADGSGRATTVVTDAAGAAVFTLVLRATERTGQRTLVAQTIDGQVASVAVKVLAKGTAFGPNSAAWPRG